MKLSYNTIRKIKSVIATVFLVTLSMLIVYGAFKEGSLDGKTLISVGIFLVGSIITLLWLDTKGDMFT